MTSKYYDVLILCLQPQGKGISCLAIYYILASTFGLWNNNEKKKMKSSYGFPS